MAPFLESWTSVHRFRVAPAVVARVKEVGGAEGAALFPTLLAAFVVLLGRHTGEEEVVVGAVAPRRARDGGRLPLRVDLAGDPSFRLVLARVREGLDGAAVHPDVPMMAAGLDLALEVVEDGDGLAGALRFDAGASEAGTIARIAERFRVLLEGIATAPDRRISALPLLPESERRLVLEEWSDGGRAVEDGARLHDLFGAQAERTPGAVALVHGDAALTYVELHGRANRLARYLHARGIGPGARVGVCLERTPEMVVALLGVLTAGAAYVPLDPAYPRERLAVTLRDAGAALVLTATPLLDVLPADAADRVCLDGVGEEVERCGAGPFDGAALAESAAYLIYTSGSTGAPKGVVVEHRAVVAFLRWAAGAFPRASLDGVLASTSICFDISVLELFLPLAVGGTVVLAGNALELPGLPARGRVTLVNTVPSAATELVRAGGLPAGVRLACLGAEPVRRALADALYGAGVPEVANLYGPTEDTVYSTWSRVPPDDPREPSIGRPITGARALVLDRALEPSPVGVAGELYLGGAGVARGYHGRPGPTAERFVPDPFPAVPGARLYRTGDQVRWRADGELEFLGRLDHQVKVRGFRVEPGEVESVVLGHPAVHEAVVVARGDAAGVTVLAAYVAGEEGLSPAGVTAWAAERLPEFMVPSAVVVLGALPRTPNGKTDRQALPAPPAVAAAAYAPPRTETEEALAGVWREVLGTERVGSEDHFFRLGGHSLMAARVMAGVWERFGVDLPLHRVFEAPTLAGMAALIDGEREAALARMLAELDGLSDEEARLLLAAEEEAP